MTLMLHNFFRSSTSTRLRAALNLNGLDHEHVLLAQVWNNRHFDTPLQPWPNTARVFAKLDQLPAIRDAEPPNQPDAT